MRKREKRQAFHPMRWWMLALYDFVPLLGIYIFILVVSPSYLDAVEPGRVLAQLATGVVCIYGTRISMDVYKSIWRFADTYAYIRLIEADLVAGVLYYLTSFLTFIPNISFIRKLSIVAMNLLCGLSMRLMYQFLYQYASRNSRLGNACRAVVRVLSGLQVKPVEGQDLRIRIAIVGAGRVGTMLAEELLGNQSAPYLPVCFVDNDPDKMHRQIYGLPVLSDQLATLEALAEYSVQEIVFAIPKADAAKRQTLYEHYSQTGCRIKIYDYPLAQTTESGKRQMREFDIEDLLFRPSREVFDDRTVAYYEDRVVLITGGGGSIGGELCRQIARMAPKRLVVLDVYENGAYDIQHELRIAYGNSLDVRVEIASVCDRQQLRRIFAAHRPDVVLHAAAHKHVPLMEHNCCEAVRNNVFGTKNTVEIAEEFGVSRFIMISTDKAVNPTNVMGATKRMCELIVLAHRGNMVCSATRFGNVLGSNGSVIPLFKKQIIHGGPVTLTDRRIIRYFMTIPEASQLVLQSGAMASHGELLVLDMGKPIRILDLAENMIRLSGFEPYKDIDIVETGLRPGEKLYEELLIRTEELDRTDHSQIFIEREEPMGQEALEQKLELLLDAVNTGSDERAKAALKKTVPTYHDPAEVNAAAQSAREMAMV